MNPSSAIGEAEVIEALVKSTGMMKYRVVYKTNPKGWTWWRSSGLRRPREGRRPCR